MLSLSSARELAVTSIREAQKSYKFQYHKKTNTVDFHLVRFPEEETGKKRKLSRPWYGPFRVISRHDPNLTVQKVYFPEDSPLTVHQLRVCLSYDMLPAGFYWYGAKRRSSGRTPTWLQRMLNAATTTDDTVRPPTEDISGPQEKYSGISGGPTSHDVLCSPSPEPVVEDSPTENLHNSVSTSQGLTGVSDGETHEDDLESIVSDHEQGSGSLQNFSALPYPVHDHTTTTPPSTSRYSLRDQSRRQQPRRLMQVNSSGRTC